MLRRALTIVRSRFMTFPRDKVVAVEVRFAIPGVGVTTETYTLNQPNDIRAWRANNRAPIMQLGLREVVTQMNRRDFVLHEKARRKAWREAIKNAIAVTGRA
jgi:hypothetical protein